MNIHSLRPKVCRLGPAGLGVSLILLVVSTASVSRGETVVHWGENPSGAGTPGTNIVQGNQTMTGAGTTYNATATNSPAVGASYYPEATGRSPRFNAAFSSISVAGGRLVENAVSGDRLATYGQFVPAGSTFRGMVMWASNHFVSAGLPSTLTNATMVAIQRTSTDATNQEMRIVIRQADSYYISESAPFGSITVTQHFPMADMSWYAFTPFSAGVETIGASVDTPSFDNVQSVGYYFSVLNGGISSNTAGINVNYFAVDGTLPGGSTYTLNVQSDDPAHGGVDPTGGVYNAGDQVELTATASNYYTFAGWSGDLGGATNPVTITMDADKTITALFTEQTATNGVPLWWLANYGLSTDDAGAISDDDNDGQLAWEEYIAGTLPDSDTSYFKVARMRSATAGTILEWAPVSGRVYQVSWRSNLQSVASTTFPDATALPWPTGAYTDTVHGAEQSIMLHINVQLE